MLASLCSCYGFAVTIQALVFWVLNSTMDLSLLPRFTVLSHHQFMVTSLTFGVYDKYKLGNIIGTWFNSGNLFVGWRFLDCKNRMRQPIWGLIWYICFFFWKLFIRVVHMIGICLFLTLLISQGFRVIQETQNHCVFNLDNILKNMNSSILRSLIYSEPLFTLDELLLRWIVNLWKLLNVYSTTCREHFLWGLNSGLCSYQLFMF